MKLPVCLGLYPVRSWKILEEQRLRISLGSCYTDCSYHEKVSLDTQSDHLLFQLRPVTSHSPAVDCDEV